MALHSICSICMLQSFIFSIEVLYNNLGCRCNYGGLLESLLPRFRYASSKCQCSLFIMFVYKSFLNNCFMYFKIVSDYKEWPQFPYPKPYSILKERCPICFHQDKLIYPVTITTIIINPNTLHSTILIPDIFNQRKQ